MSKIIGVDQERKIITLDDELVDVDKITNVEFLPTSNMRNFRLGMVVDFVMIDDLCEELEGSKVVGETAVRTW